MSKRRELGRILRLLSPTIQIVWQASPRLTIGWGMLLVVLGLLPVATVYLTRTVVDTLNAAFSAEGNLTNALVSVSLLAGVMVLTSIGNSINSWVQTAQSEQVIDFVKEKIHDQASRLDLRYYEDQSYYDMLNRATTEASYMPVTLVRNLGTLVQSSITLLAMLGVLLPFGVWVPVVLIAGALPAMLFLLRVNRRRNAWRIARSGLYRRARYYDQLLTTRETAAEVRIFGLSPQFSTRFQEIRTKLRNEQLAFVRDEGVVQLAAALTGLLTLGLSIGYLTWQTINTGGTLGDIALFYQAFYQGQSLARTLLGRVGQIHGNLLFVENLFAFLSLEPTLPEPIMPVAVSIPFEKEIALNNVSFRYPKSDRNALSDFSLTIPQGSIVAIVGENGAGKSTLLKLLTRLYDPDNGEITVDGINVRDLPLAQVRRLFTILFQVPQRYELSAEENITLGDWLREPNINEVEVAAEAASADIPINKLTDGYQTKLGKQFGNAELSVGEWQRVALARAFLRQSPVVILDEPTSAMDSWAEAEWLSRFRNFAQDKTAIIITHRFTTAMQADIIHVMFDGQIVESGTHDELMLLNGRYAVSWRSQSRNQT